MRKIKSLFSFAVLILCVQAGFAQSKTTLTDDQQKITTAVKAYNTAAEELHLGRYELYSGIPSMYIGHFILLPNGKYKVAFSTDEDNYDETGSYKFHADTQTIEWLGGMFYSNKWGGKFVKKDGGFHIEFNAATYADSK